MGSVKRRGHSCHFMSALARALAGSGAGKGTVDELKRALDEMRNEDA